MVGWRVLCDPAQSPRLHRIAVDLDIPSAGWSPLRRRWRHLLRMTAELTNSTKPETAR